MKIKDGFLLREVAGNHIVVPVGKTEVDFGGMMTLNPVGAFLWDALTDHATEDELVQRVLEAYAVEEATARQDVQTYVQKLRAVGLIED